MLNVVVLQGRMTRDPELRHTQAGKSVTSFSVAVERDFKSNGEKETDFIDVVAWGQTAEFVCNYLGKGRMIGVTGRLQVREWQDRDGNRRRSAEVQADRVYFLDSKRDNGYEAPSDYGMPAYGPQSAGGGYSAPTGEPSGFAELDEPDGDLPF